MNYFILYNCGNEFELKNIDENLYKKLLLNPLHKKSNCLIESEKIKNIFGLNIDEKCNIIILAEFNKNQIDCYLDLLSNEKEKIDQYAELLVIIVYNQLFVNNFEIKKKLELILETQSFFWEDKSNLNFNMNKDFIKRRFNSLNINDNQKFECLDFLKNNLLKEEKIKINDTNYLDELIREVNYHSYYNGSFKYYFSKNSIKTNEEILEIYNLIPSEYLRYSFICNLIVTRTHCHLVLNNNKLLEIIKPMLIKFKLIFKYIIGFAWLTFICEETKKKINDNDRIIFDFDTVNKLPVFPFSYDDINQNPYACVLIDKELINLKNNCLGLNMLKHYEKFYGTCDNKEFYKRLKLFVNLKNEDGILSKINWEKCVITGSAMTACGMKYNPLLDLCRVKKSILFIRDEDWLNFFYHYYNSSDVDIICNSDSIYEYLDVVKKLIDDITEMYEKPEIEIIKSSCMSISEEIINYELDNINNMLNENRDTIYIKKNLNNKEIKNYFFNKYYVSFKKKTDKKSNNKLYQDFNNLILCDELKIVPINYDIDDNLYKRDYEEYIFINDIYPEYKNEKNKLVLKITESIRFKLKCKDIRTIEIFKLKGKNYFSAISKFHMGFVRALWDGKAARCLPSYISSMMLQLSSDYKYFASIRDPIDIINKYRTRGFGIILNDFEKTHMAYYNSVKNTNNKWSNVYNINIKNKKSVETLFGTRNINNDIFKPLKILQGLPSDCYQEVNHEECDNFLKAFGGLNIPKLEWFLNYKAINNNGNVDPVDRNLIKVVYEKIIEYSPYENNLIENNIDRIEFN